MGHPDPVAPQQLPVRGVEVEGSVWVQEGERLWAMHLEQGHLTLCQPGPASPPVQTSYAVANQSELLPTKHCGCLHHLRRVVCLLQAALLHELLAEEEEEVVVVAQDHHSHDAYPREVAGHRPKGEGVLVVDQPLEEEEEVVEVHPPQEEEAHCAQYLVQGHE